MADEDGAKAAIKQLNGQMIDGQRIRVNRSISPMEVVKVDNVAERTSRVSNNYTSYTDGGYFFTNYNSSTYVI